MIKFALAFADINKLILLLSIGGNMKLGAQKAWVVSRKKYL
jgi:hypothetical protein